MLEDQLLLAVVFQQNRVLVEGPDLPGKFDSAYKVDGDGSLVLPNSIQERILNILCRLIFHDCRSPTSSKGLDGVRVFIRCRQIGGGGIRSPEAVRNPAM